jgi:nucleotide-binding universal stress UspA family protein
MLKDVLVPLIGVPDDANAVDFAVALCRGTEAHLGILEIVELPVPTSGPWGVMQELGLVDVYKTLREQGEKHAAAMRHRLAREAMPSDVRLIETLSVDPERMAALSARHVDLIVVAGTPGTTAGAGKVHGYVGVLLMESGTPVLMVPSGASPTRIPARRVVVGWKPTREATRALHDAIPLLQLAERVDVLIVDPNGRATAHGEPPGNDVATHLAHHGVNVHVVVEAAGDDTVGTTLLKRAATIEADLIVVGGYGHARLKEWVLGGVTHELLGAAHLPVLFSH